MAVGSLSQEAKIVAALAGFRCSITNFAEISGVVSKSRLAEGLNGTQGKSLDKSTIEKLFDRLARMQELQQSVDVPIDWSQTAKIQNALVLRLVASLAKDSRMDAAAEQATKSLSK